MDLSIDVRNFKSILSARLHLRSGLNILIGPNGSGKTCLLSALKFIRDVLHDGVAQALAKAGGMKRVYHRGQTRIDFTITCEYGNRLYRRRKTPHRFVWQIAIAQRDPEKIATIIRESLEILAVPNQGQETVFKLVVKRARPKHPEHEFRLADPEVVGADLFSEWELGRRDSKPVLEKRLRKTVKRLITHLRQFADKPLLPNLVHLDHTLWRMHSRFSFLNEYNIIPDVARQSTEQLPYARMRPDGGSVSEVLKALEDRHFHKLERAAMYEAEQMYFGESLWRRYGPFPYRYPHFAFRHRLPGMRSLTKALARIKGELTAAVSPIKDVCIQIDETNGRRFVVFRSGRDTFYPEEVSDGTIKWFCILVSIFVPYSEVYLLEEPENFLHPWMQQRLIELMRSQAEEEETIFVLTTHSPTILNAVEPLEVLVVRPSKQGTQISEIEDRREIDRVLSESKFRLGDLWVSGAIGGVPSGT